MAKRPSRDERQFDLFGMLPAPVAPELATIDSSTPSASTRATDSAGGAAPSPIQADSAPTADRAGERAQRAPRPVSVAEGGAGGRARTTLRR